MATTTRPGTFPSPDGAAGPETRISPETQISNVSRRQFLQTAAWSGGLVLAVSAGVASLWKIEAGGPPPGMRAGTGPGQFNAYLAIDPSGAVTIIAHRSEMGQGIRTSLPMVLADELGADWGRVRIEQAHGDEALFGNQDTDGSRSLRSFYRPMREAGAAARLMLERAAAKRWGVPVEEVEARDHRVVHRSSDKSLGFGELAAEASVLPMPKPAEIVLKPASALRYIGRGVPMADFHDITVGAARYGIDVMVPGMKFAVVMRPPVYGGKVASFDPAPALQVPGVERVIEIKGTPPPAGFQPVGGVAVVGRNSWAAMQGRAKLDIKWDDGPNAAYDSAAYRSEMVAATNKPAKAARNEGDVDKALAGAARRVKADYYVPHLAHATMEPPSAVAVVTDGRCEVWAPTQNPQGARDELAKALGLPVDKVHVNVTLLGGAFGRKSKPDFIVEAALLAKEMNVPIKVVWTREDDLQHDYYHTVSAQHLEAGLDAGGKAVAWLHRTAFPSISSTFAPNVTYASEAELGMGVTDVPFDIPNLRCENAEAPAHVRIGWLRSVNNIQHAFAIGSFADELAHAAGRDPRDYLLDLIGPARVLDLSDGGKAPWNYGEDVKAFPFDNGRLRSVVEVVTKEAGWGRTLPKGQGLGLAVHRSFVSYVAAVVEVHVDAKGALTVPRVDIAIDCGLAAHPDRVSSQLEGATIMGLGLALSGQITFSKGRVDQQNFADYEVLRIDAAPRAIHTHIVPSTERPGGVGEPGLPPIAPALCNAIFAATGKRIRQLPIARQLQSS
jgi:isoquinoline 1-oxidoreductase beta subunit